MTTTFYPPLSVLIPVEDLPNELGFIKDGLSFVFNKLYFKDLQYSKSARGDAAFYSLSIVSPDPIALEIPGTGIFLVLNPPDGGTTSTYSKFPITLSYRWGILAYLRAFNLSNFSFTPAAFYDLGLTILGVSEVELVNRALTVFVTDPNPVQAFVDAINDFYNPTTPLQVPTGADPIPTLVNDIETQIGNGASVVLFALYILDSADLSGTKERLNDFFSSFFGGSFENYIKSLIIPNLRATLELGAQLEFPRNILDPLDASGESDPDPNARATFKFVTANFEYSTEEGFGYEAEIGGTLSPCQIGKTGLKIAFTDAKLDLSRKENITEADLDGRPPDFIGMYVREAYVVLPEKWFKNQDETTARIVARNLIVGTGGISGLIGLEAVGGSQSPALVAKLGNNSGFEIGFKSFDILFKQNAVLESNVNGFIKIPGFKDADGNIAQIDINMHFESDGDFKITASETQGIRLIKIEDILDVRINSLSVGREDDRFFVAISGVLDFADQGTSGSGASGFLGNNLPKDIEIQKLIIWEDGKIEFEGGSLQLRKPITLKIKPVELTITALHIGSYEQMRNNTNTGLPELRQYKYVGFDGGVSIKPGGVDARGDGIKFYFTVDNNPGAGRKLHVFIRIQSIAIDIIIPGDAKPDKATLLLNGYLSMKEPSNPGLPDAGTEYAGGISFTLPKLKMGGSAAMRYNPKVPSFLIDVNLEIATPIPLGPTGLGIYGFRALFGRRYVATKQAANLTDDDLWYQYYKAKLPPNYKVGIQPEKFEQKEGFSLGAGVSLATSGDSGKVFSAKVFFLLSLPDVFLLEGQGQILKKRIGLNDPTDPPFYAFVAITNQSVETALGVNYKLPEDGSKAGQIVKVDGLIELAFFFGNSSGWYVNLGRDLPEEKRIQARILDLFNAYFYLMISSSGIKAGAGASFYLKKKFGPLSAELSAYLDIAGKIAFKPKQIGGSIQLGGSVKLKIFWFKFGISAHVGLAAEAPQPYIITGILKVCVRVLRKDRCAKFNLTWTKGTGLDTSEIEVVDPLLSNAAKAVNIMSRDTFDLYAVESNTIPNPSTWGNTDNYIIPLDSFIDIEFKTGVHPDGPDPTLDRLGGVTHGAKYVALVAPQKGKSDQVKHEFYVDKVEIKCWNPVDNIWEDYYAYEAITAFDVANFPELASIDVRSLKQGFWQADDPKKYNKLRLLAQTPLSYMTQGSGDLEPESFNITTETIFCEDIRLEKRCVNLKALQRFDVFENSYIPAGELLYTDGVLFNLPGLDGDYVDKPYQDYRKAVKILEKESLEMFFNEPTACVSLVLQTTAPSVKVYYYEKYDTGLVDINGHPVFDYRELLVRYLTQAQLQTTIEYESGDNPVDKVVIVAGCCKEETGLSCDREISREAAQLQNFLSALARFRDLTNPELQLSRYIKRYNNIFFNTLLYPALVGRVIVWYKAIEVNPGTLHIDLYDEFETADYNCDIDLTVINLDEEFSFDRAVDFVNLRPDSDFLEIGANYHFLIDILVPTRDGIRTYTAKGRSCYPVINCEIDTGEDPECCVTQTDVQSILDELVEINRLVQTRALNISTGSTAAEFTTILANSVFDTVPDGEPVFYRSNILNNGFEIIFETGTGYRLVIRLTPSSQSVFFAYNDITDFFQVRPIGDQTNKEQLNFNVSARHNTIILPIEPTEPTNPVDDASNPQARVSREVDDSGNEVLVGDNVVPIDPGIINFEGQANLQCDVILPLRRIVPTVPDADTGDFVCGSLTQEAKDLLGFFNTMIRQGHFGTKQQLLTIKGYFGVFWNTSLYNGKLGAVTYTSLRTVDINRAVFRITDELGFLCNMELEILEDVPFSPYDVSSFSNLRIDPDNLEEGENFCFLIDGIIPATPQVRVTMKGKTCYPIVTCESKECCTFLYQLCYQTEFDYSYNETIPSQSEVQNDNDAMLNGLNKTVQPIWRPNSYFAIQIKTRDKLSAGGNNLTSYDNSYVFGFKTKGGIGYFHNYLDDNNNPIIRNDFQELINNNQEDSYKLATLNHYIDYSKSYPNADGRLTNSKPLFYINPQLLLFYNRQYVFAMFSNWAPYCDNSLEEYNLEAIIKDPVLDTPFVVGAEWERNDFPVVSQDVNTLNNMMINGVPCSVTEEITSIGINSEFIAPELKPLKAYTAIFNAQFVDSDNELHNREVHRYVFQTSRYGYFGEQVMSYLLRDEQGVVQREAVFDLDYTILATSMAIAQTVVNDSLPSTDDLRYQFSDIYDRLIDGVLELGALQAAMTTEFNVVRNGNTIIGILIRNPEPFNDPKTPEDILAKTLVLSVNGGPETDNKVIFSKDNAKAFITNNNAPMNMPTGNYAFTFRYKLYNGNTYEDVPGEVYTVNINVT